MRITTSNTGTTESTTDRTVDRTTEGTAGTTEHRRARRGSRGRLAAVGLVAAAFGTVAATTIGPASAVVVDTDHPLIKASHFDFGTHWIINAPQLGGTLSWDSRGGVTYPELSGYLYLTNKECGRVKVEYYDTDPNGHVYLGEKHTGKHCAPGNGKTQWWINLNSYGNKNVTHVHVRLEKPSGSSWKLVSQTTADLN
jgi:hypothetical protein